MALTLDTQIQLWPEEAIPEVTGRPTESAFWRGSLASRSRDRADQKALGQFMTPPAIARFMAEGTVRGRQWAQRKVRLLDPAAGSGVLSAALVEALLAMPSRPSHVELLMCDIDLQMQPLLASTAYELAAQCERAGVGFDWHVSVGDFLLSDLARRHEPAVDAVIANPPYFKLPGNDLRARVHSSSVHGQPNIYGLFMASCAELLRPGGAYCFITPRSWTNGTYFRALRAMLCERLSIDALHLFDSRKEHFSGDAVLQEALIAWATAGADQASIAVSTSAGAADLDTVVRTTWPSTEVLGAAPLLAVTIPAAGMSSGLSSLPGRLDNLGLKVSTGPVVGFRAAQHLRAHPGVSTVPMLWMQHVHRMGIAWPRRHRAEHIEVNEQSAWMLLPNRPMVVLRRFSPKEDQCRVTAAPYLGELPGHWVGLENHLNVIHSPAGLLSADAARGLAAYLNSGRVDEHLRGVLGSTQVNAVELRGLPVPDLLSLEAMGRASASGDSVEDATAAGYREATTLARHA